MNTREKVKAFISKNVEKAGVIAAVLLAGSTSAFASGTGLGGVTTAIEGATGDVKGEAVKVIAAALGVGIVFWGAKKLWRSFKSL